MLDLGAVALKSSVVAYIDDMVSTTTSEVSRVSARLASLHYKMG